MKTAEIKHRWTGEVLFSTVVDDGDLYPLRTALERAVAQGARLVGARLVRANLAGIRDDVYEALSHAPAEARGLLAAIREGRVDGSVYEGECACLVGTIANVRGCRYDMLDRIEPDSSRPAERWFLAIRRGDTPERSQVAAITARWIEEWLAQRPEAQP